MSAQQCLYNFVCQNLVVFSNQNLTLHCFHMCDFLLKPNLNHYLRELPHFYKLYCCKHSHSQSCVPQHHSYHFQMKHYWQKEKFHNMIHEDYNLGLNPQNHQNRMNFLLYSILIHLQFYFDHHMHSHPC